MRARQFSILALVALLSATGVAPVEAQQTQPPWPNGCSVNAPLFVQNGLDAIFFGACDRHDRCWGQCNGPSPPYLGLGHKAECDAAFLANMELACAGWAGLLAFPGSGWVDVDAFLEDCSVVAGVYFAAVNTPVIAFNIFWNSQCVHGCNRDACDRQGIPLPRACGNGQCYTVISPPPPPPPPLPDPDPCGIEIGETSTWIAGGSGPPSRAPQQLSVGLQRFERRREGHIYMEEWALVTVGSGEPRVAMTSTEIFGDQVGQAMLDGLPRHLRPGEVLVVQAADHRRDGRFMPAPSLVAFEAQMEPGVLARTGDFWFRAEVDSTGRVDRVSLLDPASRRDPDALDAAIRNGLRLHYRDERRHRSIVFAQGRVTASGRLVVRGNGLVLVPQCCCGEVICV